MRPVQSEVPLGVDVHAPSPVFEVVEVAVGVGNDPATTLLPVLAHDLRHSCREFVEGQEIHHVASEPHLHGAPICLQGHRDFAAFAGFQISQAESLGCSPVPALHVPPVRRLPRVIESAVLKPRTGVRGFAPDDSSEGVHSAHGRSVVVGV